MRSLLFAVVLLSACGKNSDPPPPTSGSPNAKPESGPRRPGPAGGEPSQAQQMFAMVCATCHGIDGAGKGPAAETLATRPRDYSDPKWQANITDEQIREIIVKGGQGVGKSPLMPGQPALQDHPEVLDELVQIIRKFGKQK